MKVVCINDQWDTYRFPKWDFPNGLPVKGNAYVVVEITTMGGVEGYCLLGYPAIFGGRDWGYKASRFRCIDAQKEINHAIESKPYA